MSARWSTLGSALACSGDMYAGVPSATPSDVRPPCSALLDARNAFATPKSVTIALPPESSTFSADVAVHDAVFVRIRERGGDLAQHANGMVDGQLAVPGEANPQRLAVHERHREVRQAVRLARGEQRHDVWMLELGRQEDLGLETFERDLRRGLPREHLDHDLAVERGLLRDEHARHPTAAEFALERVASAQGRLQLVAEIRRRQASLRS